MTNGMFYDGTEVTKNCTSIDKIQFSYLAGTYITGAAHMYNMTNGASKWKTALDGLLNNTQNTFFTNDIMVEVACELAQSCDTDMKAYKGITARWLASYSNGSLYQLDHHSQSDVVGAGGCQAV